MSAQEQAYIYGFVKRANEYGFNEDEAFSILKAANNPVPPVAMPTRASVMSQPKPMTAPLQPPPISAPVSQPPAAVANPDLYRRLKVKFNGNPDYTSPPNKPNEADMMDVAGYPVPQERYQ